MRLDTPAASVRQRGGAQRQSDNLGGRLGVGGNEGTVLEERTHLGLRAEEVAESGPGEDRVQGFLDVIPKQSQGAIRGVGAGTFKPRVPVTEMGSEETATEQGEHLGDGDLIGGAGQSVAAGLSTNAGHETAEAQDAHQFGDIGDGKPLRAADLGDAMALLFAVPCHVQKAPQSVLFLGAQLHTSIVSPFESKV